MNTPSQQWSRRAGAEPFSRRRVVRGAAGIVALGGMLGSPATPLVRGALVRAQGEERTLTLASYGSPIDLDPHSAAEDRSAMAIRGAYEQLIAL
jgi:ferric-dicitrate binding protein FerR (iron transport regulator)